MKEEPMEAIDRAVWFGVISAMVYEAGTTTLG